MRSCGPASLPELEQELVRRNKERIILQQPPDNHGRVRPHDVHHHAGTDGNRVLAGGEVALVEQTQVHHAEDAMRFIVEAAQDVAEIAVVSALGGASEMALLAQLGTLIGQLPADPLSDIVFARDRVRSLPGSGALKPMPTAQIAKSAAVARSHARVFLPTRPLDARPL